ncbi:hypothetical protein [Thermobacillus sp. ZCTH02-B1]|uniref:hypothetical protein n=1 Tax=Thermobacillus sp. ZCTH02-B1 TaxID=1858795 RepID=UPI0025F5F06B|nr:hypothetical protein [Thermobacillus sp. ZCTH02-B1]
MLSRKWLILIGFGWLVIGGFTALVQMMAEGSGNVEYFFVVISLAIISFSMASLAPHLQRNDERMRYIRRKGALYTSVLALLYCGALWVMIRYGYVKLNAEQTILILLSLISSTLFLSWLVLSKRH